MTTWLVIGIVALIAIVGGVWLWRSVIVDGPIGDRLFGPRPPARIEVVEVAPFDAKRRLVLIRRDDREHLLLTGGPVDVVVETGIIPPPPRPVADAPTAPAAADWQMSPGNRISAQADLRPPELPDAGIASVETAPSLASPPPVDTNSVQTFRSELVAEPLLERPSNGRDKTA